MPAPIITEATLARDGYVAVSIGPGATVWGTGRTRMAALEDARRALPPGAEPRLNVRATADDAPVDAETPPPADGASGFAAVGTDTAGPMVWGLGATRADACADARRWLPVGDARAITLHAITGAQRAVITAGNLSWPVAS